MVDLTGDGIAEITKLSLEALKDKELNHPNGNPIVFVPDGFNKHEFMSLNPVLPDDIKQSIALKDAASFTAYINRYKEVETTGFASIANNQATAVIDYHASPKDGDTGGKPDYQKHLVSLDIPFERDWKRWQNVDGVLMSQEEFVYFLEEMAHTIKTPTGADLMELVHDLKISRTSSAGKVVHTKSGATELEFREADQTQNSQGETVTLPDEILIEWPIYFGFSEVQVKAKFRYRKAGAEFKFMVSILNRENLEQDSFQELITFIEAETSVPFYYGARVRD